VKTITAKFFFLMSNEIHNIVHLLLLTSFFCLLVLSASKQQQLWVTSTIFIQLGTNRPEITELFSLGQGCGSGS